MENKLNKKYKYKSLSHSYAAQDMDVYGPIITQLLDEKEYEKEAPTNKYISNKNKNIAITGGFGSGKSSIINTYFKDNKNVIYVSLGSYIETSNNISKNKKISDMDRIETSILQQIIYSVRPSKVPLSRINRIDKGKYKYFLFNALLSLILDIIFIFILYFANYENILLFFNARFSVLFSIIFFVCVYLLIYTMSSKISNYKFNKVNINGVELSKEESSISVLNRNIDELIHFFDRTNYNIIIFEDIDRLNNCREVFSKLKEINMILNNSINNKTIQFIYAISDTIFTTAEERTKFFDGIVTIVPYSGIKTSRDLFETEEVKDLNFDSEIIKEICRYVDNPRIAYDIINEYSIFNKILEKQKNSNQSVLKSDKKTLLVLSAYKVLYPKKYDFLLRNEGKVAFYISSEFMEYAKNEICENENNELKKIKKLRSITSDYSVNFKKYLIEIIENNIYKKSESKNTIEIYAVKENEEKLICTLTELAYNINDYIEEIKSNNIIMKTTNRFNGTLKCNEDEIFNFISKNDFLDLLEYSNEYYDKDKLDVLSLSLEKKINEFDFYKIDTNRLIDLINNIDIEKLSESFKIHNNLTSKENSKLYKLNNFEIWMLKNKMIDSTFRHLVIKNHGLAFSRKDDEIVKLIKNHENTEYNTQIDEVKNVINEITEYDFSYDSICIKKIFIEILKNKDKYINCLDRFFSNMNSVKFAFLIKLDKENSNINAMFRLQKYLKNLVKYVSENEEKNNNYEYFVCRLVNIYNNTFYKPITDFIIDYFNNIDDIEKIFIRNKNLLDRKFKEYKLSFNQTSFNLHYKYKPFYEYVYNNNMLNCNYKLIASIARVLKIPFYDNKVLESVHKSQNKLAEYIDNNLKESIKMIYNFGIKQNDSEDFISKYINSNEFEEDTLELFIKMEDIKFSDISKIKHYNLLKREDKIAINFNNLNTLFEFNENIIDEYIAKTVNNNIDELIKENISHDTYQPFFRELHKTDLISFETFTKIIDKVFDGWHYKTYQNDMLPERNNYLIDNDKMYTDNYKDIIEVLQNSNLTEARIIKYIQNSFNDIKDKQYDEMTSKLLNYIARIDYNNQELVDYLMKYENKFDSITFSFTANICLEKKVKLLSDQLYRIILNSSLNSESKLRFYNLYNNELEEYTYQLMPLFGDEYSKIVDGTKNMKKIKSTTENDKLLDFLDKCDNKYFDHYKKIGRILYVYYHPSKFRKNLDIYKVS